MDCIEMGFDEWTERNFWFTNHVSAQAAERGVAKDRLCIQCTMRCTFFENRTSCWHTWVSNKSCQFLASRQITKTTWRCTIFSLYYPSYIIMLKLEPMRLMRLTLILQKFLVQLSENVSKIISMDFCHFYRIVINFF